MELSKSEDAPESSSKPAKQNRNPSTGGKAKRAPVPRSNRYQPYLKNALLAVEPSEGLKPSWLLIFVSELWKYFAIALKPIKQSDSAPTSSKPRNDALSAQVSALRRVFFSVNSIRQELQLLASNRRVTIITSNRSGGRKAGVIIVIVVLDYGYVWWKGWKLPDFMFATKRGLKDACNSVSNELTKVFHSVEVTKKTISSTLNESSCKYDEIIASTSSDKDKDVTKDGVAKLLLCTLDADNRLSDLIQDSPNASRPALEQTRVALSSRTVSLPAALPLELPSPSASSRSGEMNDHLRSAENASSPRVSSGTCSPDPETLPSPDVSHGQPVRSAGFLSQIISATLNFKFV